MNNFIQGILSTNIALRKKAVEDIIKNGDVELAKELKKIAEEGPTYAKLGALTAYGRIINKEEIEYIYPYLNSKDWHIRLETIKIIHFRLGEDAISMIEPFLKDKAYGVRSEVERILKTSSSNNK